MTSRKNDSSSRAPCSAATGSPEKEQVQGTSRALPVPKQWDEAAHNLSEVTMIKEITFYRTAFPALCEDLRQPEKASVATTGPSFPEVRVSVTFESDCTCFNVHAALMSSMCELMGMREHCIGKLQRRPLSDAANGGENRVSMLQRSNTPSQTKIHPAIECGLRRRDQSTNYLGAHTSLLTLHMLLRH